jgi:hypothetical protein
MVLTCSSLFIENGRILNPSGKLKANVSSYGKLRNSSETSLCKESLSLAFGNSDVCPLRVAGDLQSFSVAFWILLTGRRMVKVQPCPGSESNPMLPPLTVTAHFTMDRPRPVPPSARVRASSTR